MQEAPTWLISQRWPRHESHSDESGTRRILTNLPQIWSAANCHQLFFLFSVGVVGKDAGTKNQTGETGRRTMGCLSVKEIYSQYSRSRVPRPPTELGKLPNSSDCSSQTTEMEHTSQISGLSQTTGAITKNPRIEDRCISPTSHLQSALIQATENRS